MPPFWMSYIQVSDLEQTVGLAEQHGAKVEVRPTSASGGGQVALIRDPSGAGFTCYQGDAFSPKNASLIHGTQVWNELHVSDLTLIKDFYEKVFDWRIEHPMKMNDIRCLAKISRLRVFKSLQMK